MLLKTILNSVTDYKSFVFTKVSFTIFDRDDVPTKSLVAEIKPRKNSPGICSECSRKCPTYDTAADYRWFEFVPLWKIPVWFIYRMRRVTCPDHGVIVAQVPWGDGKHTQTVEMRQFLANWARRWIVALFPFSVKDDQ